jgi:Restriction endonuclease
MDDVENLPPATDNLGTPSTRRLGFHASHSIATSSASEMVITSADGYAETFEPGAIRYIKLGENGKWASKALEQGIIPFGYRLIDHHSCLVGDWDEVRRKLIGMGRTAQGASQGLRELREFYDLPADTLWVTAADGHFWWTFADGPVVGVAGENVNEPARYRRTRAGWSNQSLTGRPLTVRGLSSALTRTANYQMTICTVKHADYLLRRIRDERNPLHTRATELMTELREIGLRMIQQLDWRDFETLVDLIFARGGWQRTSVLGKDQADVDLILNQPITGETAWVQIKSRASQAVLDDYLDRFRRDGSCDCFFFVCHSATGPLTLPAHPRLHLWTGERLSDAAIDAGLLEWLIERTS